MFEGALEKVNEALTRMSKTLSMFEKEYTDLRVKCTEELMAILDNSNLRIKDRKEILEKAFADHKEKLDNLTDLFKQQTAEAMTTGLDLYSQEIKKRFEGLYIQFEEEAKKRAQQTFDTDMAGMFEKYGDQIAPFMFKSLIRYIFHIKKKS